MTRLTFDQLLIANLGDELPRLTRGYIPKERAYEILKESTGQDFGYDVKAWKKWITLHFVRCSTLT
jgi:hypothetical protein